MPTITNTTRQDLFCVPLRRVLRGGETAEATDSQAAQITATGIFVVGADKAVGGPVTNPTLAVVANKGPELIVKQSDKAPQRAKGADEAPASTE